MFQDTTPSVINWQDYEGRTALHLAVADGNAAVVKALVSHFEAFTSEMKLKFMYAILTECYSSGGGGGSSLYSGAPA